MVDSIPSFPNAFAKERPSADSAEEQRCFLRYALPVGKLELGIPGIHHAGSVIRH